MGVVRRVHGEDRLAVHELHQVGHDLPTAELLDRAARGGPIVEGHEHPNEGHRRNGEEDRKSTRLNSSHVKISYAVFCLKKKKRLRINICLNHETTTPS